MCRLLRLMFQRCAINISYARHVLKIFQLFFNLSRNSLIIREKNLQLVQYKIRCIVWTGDLIPSFVLCMHKKTLGISWGFPKCIWGFSCDSISWLLVKFWLDVFIDCWSILLHVYVMEGATMGLGLWDCMTMGLGDWDWLPLGLQDCQQKAKKSGQAWWNAYPTHANNFRFRFRAGS